MALSWFKMIFFFFFTGRQFKRVKLVLVFFSAGFPQAILNTSQVRNVLEWPLTGTQDTPL